MNDILKHYGVSKQDGAPGRGSGRYPLGSGERPRSQNNKTVFISGSSKTQSKDSEYYRAQLPKQIKNKIDGYIDKGHKIIVGDAPGIDRQVQNYLKKKGYSNVEVYSPGTKERYKADKSWKSNLINAPEFEPMSPEWLAKKDIAMNKSADIGLAVVLDEGGAKATRNNVQRFHDDNKEVEVYEISKNGKKNDKWIKEDYQKANEIYDTLSDEEKRLVTARDTPPDKYTDFNEYHSYLAKNFLREIKDVPVSTFDIWREGDEDVALAIMTRSGDEYRGKGYAGQLVQKGVEWLQNNPQIKNAYWDVRKDNTASIKLAEKNGFKKDGTFKDDNWLIYKKTFKR